MLRTTDIPDTDCIHIPDRRDDDHRKLVYDMRCQLVSLAYRDYEQFRTYLFDNEGFFKENYHGQDAVDMRRICRTARDRKTYGAYYEDEKHFDDIFGPYIESEPPRWN